jgi:hypothetical protein
LRVNRPSSAGNPSYGSIGVTVSTTVAHSRIGTPDDPWSDVTSERTNTDAVVLSSTGTGPSITQGSAEPSSTPEDGSIYLRTDGTTWQYTTAGGWVQVGASSGAACAPAINDCIITDNGDGTLSITYADFQDSHGNRRAGYGFVDESWYANVPGAKTVVYDPIAGTVDGLSAYSKISLPGALGALGYTQAAVPEDETVYGAIIADRATGKVFFCRNQTGGADGDRPSQLELDTSVSSMSNPNGALVFGCNDGSSSEYKSYGFRIQNHYRAPMTLENLYSIRGSNASDITARLDVYSVDGATGYPDELMYTSGEVTVAAQAVSGVYADSLFAISDAVVDPGESVWIILTRTDTAANAWQVGCGTYGSIKTAGGWNPEGMPFIKIENQAAATWKTVQNMVAATVSQLGCKIDVSRDGCFTMPEDVFTTATKTLASQYRIMAAWGPITEGVTPTFVFCGMRAEIYAGYLSLSAGECAVAVYPPDGADQWDEVMATAPVAPFTGSYFDPVLFTGRGLAKKVVIQSGAADTVHIIEHPIYQGVSFRVENRVDATVTLDDARGQISEDAALTKQDECSMYGVRVAAGQEKMVFQGRKA